MTYVAITEHMKTEERETYDRDLNLAPGRASSSGTAQVMALMEQGNRGGARGRRPGTARTATAARR